MRKRTRRLIIAIIACWLALTGGLAAWHLVSKVRANALVRDLASEDPAKSRAAAEKIAQTKSRAVIKALVKALIESEEHEEAYGRFVDTLAAIGQPAVGPLLRKTSYRWPDAIQSLLDDKYGDPDRLSNYASDVVVVEMDKRAVESLLACLKHRNYGIRRDAAYFLGDIGDPRAVGPLIETLGDEHWMVRMEAAASLGLLGSKKATDPLIAALGDPDGYVRFRAAEALGNLGDDRAVAPLIEALDKRKHWVDRGAMKALGNLRAREAVEPLLAKIAEGLGSGGGQAAYALGRIGDPDSVTPLIAHLESENSSTVGAAARALGLLKAAEAVEPLIKAFETYAEETAGTEAAEALGRIGDARAAEPMVEYLTAWLTRANVPLRSDMRGWTGGTKAPLHMLDIPEEDPVWRGELMDFWHAGVIIEALGELKDPDSSEAIAAFLDCPLDRLRRNAAWALGALGDARAVEPLLAAVINEEWGGVDYSAVAALGRLGDESVVSTLVPLLNSDAEWVAHKAAIALEMIGTPEARAAVDGFLGETDLEEVARDYRERIKKERGHHLVVIALWRHGAFEMAADLKWSRDWVLILQAEYWAERNGLADELEATEDSPSRPRHRRHRSYVSPSSD
ncbi:MAG: HEAT repeat domain-containing protein [Planctomycetota bacterium]|jgi:HEAT repeat protein